MSKLTLVAACVARQHADLLKKGVCQGDDLGEFIRGRTTGESVGELVQLEEVARFVHPDGGYVIPCHVAMPDLFG